MNAEPKMKKGRPDCGPKRPNIKSIDGETLLVFVLRRKLPATAILQDRGYGADAERYARKI